MPKETDPCKKYACAIQRCLSANSFQEPSCQEAIKDMQDCCMKWKHRSYVCDGFKNLFEQIDQEASLGSSHRKPS